MSAPQSLPLSGYCITFDLDGTLVETAPDLIGTLNEVIGAKGVPPFAIEAARNLVGRGARALIQRGFAAAGLELTPEDEDPMVTHFLALYRERIDRLSRPFPGLIPALEALKDLGATLSVCTNKPQDLSVLLLTRLNMIHYFKSVRGADSVPAKKPDPGHLWACADDAGLSRDKTWLIGDSETDFLTSRNAGTPSILVSFGYSEPPAAELKADALLDHYDELVPAILRLLK